MGDVKAWLARPQGGETGKAGCAFCGFRLQKWAWRWALERGLIVFTRLTSDPAAKNAIELIKYDAGQDRKD